MPGPERTIEITVVPKLDPEAAAALQRGIAAIQASISELEFATNRAALSISRALRTLREQEFTVDD